MHAGKNKRPGGNDNAFRAGYKNVTRAISPQKKQAGIG